MARKDTLQAKISTAQSLSATFTSPVTLIKNTDNVSYQINATTADAVGTFKVQGSDDYRAEEPMNAVLSSGSWADIPLGGDALSLASANDTLIISMNQLPFQAVRIVYTRSSGTGSCDIWISTKQLGG